MWKPIERGRSTLGNLLASDTSCDLGATVGGDQDAFAVRLQPVLSSSLSLSVQVRIVVGETPCGGAGQARLMLLLRPSSPAR